MNCYMWWDGFTLWYKLPGGTGSESYPITDSPNWIDVMLLEDRTRDWIKRTQIGMQDHIICFGKCGRPISEYLSGCHLEGEYIVKDGYVSFQSSLGHYIGIRIEHITEISLCVEPAILAGWPMLQKSDPGFKNKVVNNFKAAFQQAITDHETAIIGERIRGAVPGRSGMED